MSSSPYGDYKDEYDEQEEQSLELREYATPIEARPWTESQQYLPQHTNLSNLQRTAAHGPRMHSRMCSFLLPLFWGLLPSFISQRSASSPPPRGQRLALSGLRGLACMMVFQGHYLSVYTSTKASWYRHVPFIQIFVEGGGAVPIFFIISGYVLSRRPVKLMREERYSDMLKAIASATLRRGPRLFIPCFVAGFLTMLLTAFGAFDTAMVIWKDLAPPVMGPFEHPPLPTLFYRYWLHVQWLLSAIYPFEISVDQLDYYSYDPHQWSIPVEFYSSLAMFATIIAVSQLRTSWRITSLLGLYFYLYMSSRQRCTTFFTGLLIAEGEAAIEAHRYRRSPGLPGSRSSSEPSDQISSDDSRLGQALLCYLTSFSHRTVEILSAIAMIIGVTMLTAHYNEDGISENIPHWIARHVFWLPDLFLIYHGGMLIVVATMCSTFFEPLFTNALTLYLGEISFGIYLVHGSVFKSLGYYIIPLAVQRATGLSASDQVDAAWFSKMSQGQAFLAGLLSYIIVCPVVIWAADLFWRFIDKPSVAYTKRLEKALLRPSAKST